MDDHPVFSPNSSKVAFTKYGDGEGVYISVVPGGIPQKISDYGRVPVWLDEKTVVIGNYAGDNRPHVIDLETGETTVVRPDGKSIYYGDTESNQLMKLDMVSTGRSEVIMDNARVPALSPDGKWLAMAIETEEEWDLYLMDLVTGDLVSVDSSSGNQNRPQFSPDSRHLVYLTTSRYSSLGYVRVAEVQGPARYPILQRQVESPQWSADGRYIYVSDFGDRISRMRISTEVGVSVQGQIETVGRVGVGAAFAVSRLSQHIAVISTDFFQSDDEADQPDATLIWWENWTQEMRRP